jgi:hypothetical protein
VYGPAPWYGPAPRGTTPPAGGVALIAVELVREPVRRRL